MEQKKGKVLATSNQVTSKGNVEIEMFLQAQKYKNIVSVCPQDGAKYDLCTVFLSCLHESPRLRMHFHYSAAKCIQVLSEREQ